MENPASSAATPVRPGRPYRLAALLWLIAAVAFSGAYWTGRVPAGYSVAVIDVGTGMEWRPVPKVNRSGQIAGFAVPGEGGDWQKRQALLYEGGKPRNLGGLG